MITIWFSQLTIYTKENYNCYNYTDPEFVREISKRTFLLPESFNLKEYYRNSFGIIRPGDQPIEEIILSFSHDQGKYIKSPPLHDSQHSKQMKQNWLWV